MRFEARFGDANDMVVDTLNDEEEVVRYIMTEYSINQVVEECARFLRYRASWNPDYGISLLTAMLNGCGPDVIDVVREMVDECKCSGGIHFPTLGLDVTVKEE